MRFLLTSDWPAWGDIALPAGTVLEAGKGVLDGGRIFWNGRVGPQPMPIESMALDSDAARLMLGWYGDSPLRHRLRFGPGVEV
jgi:hypothetical protein